MISKKNSFAIIITIILCLLFTTILFKKKCDDSFLEIKKAPNICQSYLANNISSKTLSMSINDLEKIFGPYQHEKKSGLYFFRTSGDLRNTVLICVMEVKPEKNGTELKARHYCH